MMEFRCKNIRECGVLWRFPHFFHDFLLPFFDFYRQLGFPAKIKIYLLNIDAQHLGNMADKLKVLFPVEIAYLSDPDFQKSIIPLKILNGYNFGPYSSETLAGIRKYVEIKLSPEDQSYPKILLIKRGNEKMPFGVQENSGKNRGYIANHDKLRRALKKIFKQNLADLVLEQIEFVDQIKYFYNANLVIGQHGGGLCNITWMKKNTRVIEIGPRPLSYDTFGEFCKAKDMQYMFYLPNFQILPVKPDKQIISAVDIKDFINEMKINNFII